MPLLDEVAAAADSAREAERTRRAERTARLWAEAGERFVRAFGEEPELVKMGGQTVETRDGSVTIHARLEYQGVTFAALHGRGGHPELHVLLECPVCGREFVSNASFFGMKLEHTAKDRERNVAELARALEEPTNYWRHQCRENVLGPVRFAVRDAARKLGVSECQVMGLLEVGE